MATIITGSSNIAVLDTKVKADLCVGNFIIDATPSTYIGAGAGNVLGINVSIKNPFGVAIKGFTTSGYDIEDSSKTEVVEVRIPTEAGNYQYGNYTILATLYDADGTQYSVTKTVTISIPDTKNKTKKFGKVSATIKGLCKEGKAIIQVDEPQTYRGKLVESVVQEFTLTYPGGSNFSDLVTELSSFSVPLFEGEYKIVGQICATYNLGDNVYVSVLYKLNYKQPVKCLVNLCCVHSYLVAELDGINSDCTEEEKRERITKVARALAYIKAAELAAECNEDASVHINSLEELLDCKCTCDSNAGVPIINNAPANDFTFTGCGFTPTQAGLTKNININNYSYVVDINVNNVLTVGTPTIENCVVTIPLNFDLSEIISQVWASISANNGISIEVDEEGNRNIQLGTNPLIKDTTIGGDYTLQLSQGKLRVDNISGFGGEPEVGFPSKVIGNSKVTGQIVTRLQSLVYGTNLTWNLNGGEEAQLTLTGNVNSFNITNAIGVVYGVLKVVQDETGGRTLVLPANSKVENSGAGAITLSTAANAIDILAFRYDGTFFYWKKSPNYT